MTKILKILEEWEVEAPFTDSNELFIRHDRLLDALKIAVRWMDDISETENLTLRYVEPKLLKILKDEKKHET